MALRQHPCSQAGENKRIRGKQHAREKKEADDTSGDAGTEAMGDREQGCVDSEQSNGEDRAMLGPNEEAAAEALDDHGHAAMEHREQGCVDSEQLERLAEMLNSSRAESAINGFAIFCSYQSDPVLTSLIKRQPRDFALQLVFFDESHRTV